jgi:hypothetical protein
MSIRILTTLTENAYQSLSFVTEKGEEVNLTFRYIPSQETWFVDVDSDSLTIHGLALQAFVNLLDPYHNLISWGLYVWSKDGFDPWMVDDFSTGRIKVAVIEDFEYEVIQEFLNSGSVVQ